jgi:hypothetical protein
MSPTPTTPQQQFGYALQKAKTRIDQASQRWQHIKGNDPHRLMFDDLIHAVRHLYEAAKMIEPQS